jgi:preprotein translocase subunit SecE
MANARSERHPSVRAQPGQPEERHGHFVSEAWAELKKVEWPGQAQVIQGTVVVLIACVVVGTFLYVNDFVWKHVVSNILLGQ